MGAELYGGQCLFSGPSRRRPGRKTTWSGWWKTPLSVMFPLEAPGENAILEMQSIWRQPVDGSQSHRRRSRATCRWQRRRVLSADQWTRGVKVPRWSVRAAATASKPGAMAFPASLFSRPNFSGNDHQSLFRKEGDNGGPIVDCFNNSKPPLGVFASRCRDHTLSLIRGPNIQNLC